ncbi:hypothetical protein [Acidipropionibacterium virtanenii]|uniref:DUF4386 domain-containing protein n=1 Tax=Acidipropionibacterium virtanenii TaxID=2057246 RepID=A0A344USY7_9ACTN|nr:hypothetical protein [Acidipropionibacterium virtanenii]AXE38385.1 hypothetical protein JS278_01208 [Acidipropionibacterium virtanenii]
MITHATTGPRTPTPHRTGGPNPGIVGLVSLGLLIGSLVVMAAMSGGGTITSPFGPTGTVAGFFAEHGLAVRIAAMLQLGSAIPLGVYTATMYARQQRLGIRVPGPSIAMFGGSAAAILLAVSAVITWAQGQDVVSADPVLTHALAYLSFAAGGFAHVLGLGLLVAGIAVPALILRTMPVAFSWIGLVLAGLAELSFLTMVLEPLQVLIPVGRFGSLLWLGIAGFLIPATRSAASRRDDGARS